MAKLGEGDSRWIVDDRADGKNVGAWHWEEKDLSSQCHEALKSKFANYVLSETPLTVAIKEVSDISGDVTVAQRKGKIMCYFDLKITLKYTGKEEGESGKAEGKITIPEVDHDSYADEYELNVSTTETSKISPKVEAWVKENGRAKIRRVIKDYFDQIFLEHNVGKLVPKGPAGGGSPLTSGVPVAPATPPTSNTSAPPVIPKPTKAASPVVSKKKGTIEWKMLWRAPVEDMWSVLTQQEKASVYTRAPAKIEPKAAGTFEYLGGLISGYFVEVIHPEKLTMQWRLSSWPSGLFSSVVITLKKEEAGVTRMEFAQLGVPDGEEERVKSGWHGNFWEPIKGMFGYRLEFL